MSKIRSWLSVFRAIQQKLWFNFSLCVWAISGAYDLLISQWLPRDWTADFPPAWKIAAMTGGFIPAIGWILILALIIVIGALDYAAQKNPQGLFASKNFDSDLQDKKIGIAKKRKYSPPADLVSSGLSDYSKWTNKELGEYIKSCGLEQFPIGNYRETDANRFSRFNVTLGHKIVCAYEEARNRNVNDEILESYYNHQNITDSYVIRWIQDAAIKVGSKLITRAD